MKKAFLWSVYLLVVVLASLTTERLIAYSNWNLLHAPQWVSSKLWMVPLMGSWEFVSERQPVARGVLDLSAWHGYNEITHVDPDLAKEVSLRFRLKEGAYLWIFFDQNERRRVGIRVSRNSDQPSGLYEVSREGEILSHQLWEQTGQRENILSLRQDPLLPRAELSLNGMKRPLSWPTKGRSYLSLRSGAAQTQILSVKGRDQKGKTFEAGFSPPHQWTVFAGVAGILGVFGLIFKNKIRFTLAGAVLAFSSYAWALDYTYWSRIYPYSKEISPGKEFQERRLLELEKWRQRVFSLGQERVGIDWDQYKRVAFLITPQNKPPQKIHGAYLWFEEGKKVRGFPNGPWTGPSRHPLVFFLGTSQLYGTGASSLEQSGVGIFLHLLHQKLHRKIYGLNLSQSGATLKILLPRFQELLKSLTPDVLVVNLGHNDSSQSSKDLEAQVAVLFRECRQRNIRVVVSLEGSSKEDDRPYEALKVLKQAATENHFLIVDSRAFFRRPETLQRGVLFWDEVHLTPFGQRLWAENIFQKAPWASLLAGAR